MSWQDIVKQIAPVIGTALGGPMGGLATKAISSALFGDDEPATGKELDKKIAHAIQDDPEALLLLKKADQDFDSRMKELDIDILEISAADRADARGMAKTLGLYPQIILSSVYVVTFAVIMYLVFAGTVSLSGAQANMANILIGILSAGLLQIMNFFFGSSSGSKEKTSLIGS